MDQLLYGRVFGLPVWVVGLVVIGGGIAVYLLFFRNRSASSSGTLGQNSAGQQSAVPPVDQSLYDPYTGAPLAAETAINPATGLPNYYNGQTGPTPPGTDTGGHHLPVDIPAGITCPDGYHWEAGVNACVPNKDVNPGGGQTGGGTLTGTVRTSGSVAQYAGWDASHPQGIPVESSPGLGDYSGWLPYGSQVQVTGPGVQGTSNTGQTQGTYSTTWYPVAGGGYISAADLTGAPHGGAHGPYQGTPWWPVMMDMPVERR